MDGSIQAFLAVFTWPNFLWVVEKFGFVSVAVTVFVYWYDQRKDRIQKRQEEGYRMQRTCDAILIEIADNKWILTDTSGYVPHIKRDNGIDYWSATFGSGVYESLVNSGFYTLFRTNTQRRLSALYDRIRRYNELVMYISNYFDQFTLHDNSVARTKLYLQKIERYEKALTKWSNEINELLDASEVLIKTEKT